MTTKRCPNCGRVMRKIDSDYVCSNMMCDYEEKGQEMEICPYSCIKRLFDTIKEGGEISVCNRNLISL